jgi:predicted DCC family thiol-disulfide oxidoreductase YuxK
MTEPAQTVAPHPGEHLILYDGVCGLCNRVNQFVLPRDKRAIFDFASLQSATGQSFLQRLGRRTDAFDTFYLVTNYRSDSPALLFKARAALFVLNALGGIWRWTQVFGILPTALLNIGYDLIARNRYRLFGRYEACLMPRAEFKQRFIDI